MVRLKNVTEDLGDVRKYLEMGSRKNKCYDWLCITYLHNKHTKGYVRYIAIVKKFDNKELTSATPPNFSRNLLKAKSVGANRVNSPVLAQWTTDVDSHWFDYFVQRCSRFYIFIYIWGSRGNNILLFFICEKFLPLLL